MGEEKCLLYGRVGHKSETEDIDGGKRTLVMDLVLERYMPKT